MVFGAVFVSCVILLLVILTDGDQALAVFVFFVLQDLVIWSSLFFVLEDVLI